MNNSNQNTFEIDSETLYNEVMKVILDQNKNYKEEVHLLTLGLSSQKVYDC